MNYIKRLETENEELKATLAMANNEITNLMAYLASSKFHGAENDYAHVSTDIFPKLRELREIVS